jgi:flagellar hook capping protein FlgD
MKITKILFLGIVLVLFNLAYLAAQTLPDSVSAMFTSAEPGGELTITVDVRFHSTSPGGVILVAQDLPEGLVTTAEGVDLASGTKPTGAGTWSYEWTDGYGKVLAAQALDASVAIDPEAGTISVIMLGANVDFYMGLPPDFGGIDPSAVGPIAKLYINVPDDFAEGTYEMALADEGLQIAKYPAADGLFDGVPAFSANAIVIFDIPDNNYLDMVAASQGVASGGYTALSVMLANRDTIGSGSFTLTFPGDYLSIDSVAAGSRASGASFSFSNPQEAGVTQLAADMTTTVSFSGLTLTPGGGELCKLYFDVATVGAGVSASVALSDAALKAPGGAALTAVDPPSGGATDLTFSFGDTLSLADQTGEGTAIIMDGQLYVPIMLKNASSVSAVRFYISEPAGMEDILSLSEDMIMNVNRADGWTIVAADSGSYVQVIAYSPTEGGAIAADTGQLFQVVYDIDNTAFTVPAPGEATVDLFLGLGGVELAGMDGMLLGVEPMGATQSLDYRVPNDGEGVGPGASLPKAFSLAQNHPNPFNPSTTINYQIPDDVGSVQFRLNVYDLRGKMVRTLDQGLKGAGTYSVFWDGTDDHGRKVSSGVYFYRFSSSAYNATRKMIMLK